MEYDNTNKGAAWLKTAKSGMTYMSIKMNIEGKDYNISMFKNTKKQNENQPDYNLVLSEKNYTKPTGQAEGLQNETFKQQSQMAADINDIFNNKTDDDIPF